MLNPASSMGYLRIINRGEKMTYSNEPNNPLAFQTIGADLPSMEASNKKLLITTGIPGLDDILSGGLLSNHIYLIQGSPGSGKTTLALQFIINGAEHGEKVLYISLSETAAELNASADSLGLS